MGEESEQRRQRDMQKKIGLLRAVYLAGLAITHRIVTEHGGLMQVDSELGIGTRISLDFPL